MKKNNYHKKKRQPKQNKFFSITILFLIIFLIYIFAPSPLKKILIAANTFIKNIIKQNNTIYAIIVLAFILILFKCLKIFKRNVGAGKRLNKIDIMSGEEFEQYLMYNFQKMGYRVKTTPVTGDYGADLILSKNGTKICVQAKRYKNNVGNSAVQEIVAALAYYKCDYGMVVTNSYFTSAAKTLAKVNNIELWDRNKIINEFNIKR